MAKRADRGDRADPNSRGLVEEVTENEFLEIVRSVRDIGDPAALDLPVRETVLDSLDLAMIRSALEVRRGAPIDDVVWSGADSLRELLNAIA